MGRLTGPLFVVELDFGREIFEVRERVEAVLGLTAAVEGAVESVRERFRVERDGRRRPSIRRLGSPDRAGVQRGALLVRLIRTTAARPTRHQLGLDP